MTEICNLNNLPRTKPINLSFENIAFSVPHSKGINGRKQVLKCLNGEFRSGELTAIMGPSGAGKSSFLNILSGFRNKGMQGCIYRNGVSCTEKGGSFRKDACYIMQDDLLYPLLTVAEYMNTASQLKLGFGVSEKSKINLIDNILTSLGLTNVKDVRCSLLSGGQRKRLSIALELLDNPSVMFLDEPTTGLDSSSTVQCVSLLKALARSGRTIICTIHQPSTRVYEMFDHVYLLADGVTLYQGSSANTATYLANVGLPCPQYHSIADYIAELAAGDHGDWTERLSHAAQDSRWRKPAMPRQDTGIGSHPVKPTPPSEFAKVWILMHRNLILLYRDWTVTHLKIILHFMVGLLLGLVYRDIGSGGDKVIKNITFFMSSIIYLSYTALMPAILRFPSEMLVVKKERFNNWYTLRSYYIAFLATHTPLQFTFTLTFVSISYYMTGQILEIQRFLMFLAINFLANLTSEGLGLYCGTFASIKHALFVGSLCVAFASLYSGVLILFPHMPFYHLLVSYLNYNRYALEGLTLSMYGNGRGTLPCPDDAEYCHLRSSKRLLDVLGVQEGNYWIDVIALIAGLVIFRTMAFISLQRKVSS